MIKYFLSCLLLITVLLNPSCKDNEPAPVSGSTQFYEQPEGELPFNNVRKAVTLYDGATVYVGSSGQVPAILILNPDFSLRKYLVLDDYADGDLYNVIERAGGNIVVVGKSSSSKVNASNSNPNGFFLEYDRNGEVLVNQGNMSGHESKLPQSYPWAKYPQEDALTTVYESPTGKMWYGGILQYDGIALMGLSGSLSAFGIQNLIFYPNCFTAGLLDSVILTGRYVNSGGVNSNYSMIGAQDGHIGDMSGLYGPILAVDFTDITNWQDASPIPNPFIRSEILDDPTDHSFVFTLGSYFPFKISMTKMGLDRSVKSKTTYTGLGQTVFQNCAELGDDFLVLGSTLPLGDDFKDEEYEAYVGAVERSSGNVLWEANIPEEGEAVTALTAMEMDDHVQVSGLILDKQDKARFVQWKFDKEGNQLE